MKKPPRGWPLFLSLLRANELLELRGKVALVTGATRGIGRALVEALAEAGADVVVSSRKQEACKSVAIAIEEKYRVTALPVACHMGRWDEVSALAQDVLDKFGRCDILINNAGMTPAYSSLEAITEDYYDKVASVNLKGPFRLAVLLGAQMARTGGGSIINISSTGALRPGADELVYCAAKAGLNAMSIGLAEAFGPSVRVNTVLPGLVDTDMSSTLDGAQRQAVATQTPLGRIGVPADVVGPVLWLAGQAAAYVTGAFIRVDGGAFRQM